MNLKEEIKKLIESYNDNLQEDYFKNPIFGISENNIKNLSKDIYNLIEPATKSEPIFNCSNDLHMVDKEGICVNCGLNIKEKR